MSDKKSNLREDNKSLESELLEGLTELLDSHMTVLKGAGCSDIKCYSSALGVLSECISNVKDRVTNDGFDKLSILMKDLENVDGGLIDNPTAITTF